MNGKELAREKGESCLMHETCSLELELHTLKIISGNNTDSLERTQSNGTIA